MKRLKNNAAEFVSREIQTKFLYDSATLLTLRIAYPQLSSLEDPFVQDDINDHYRQEEESFYNYASGNLLDDALVNYNESVKKGFPFRVYDAVMLYTVTMNENCIFSTYFDQYQFTGGAHGSTIRYSDNWQLQTGRRIRLKDLFKRTENPRSLLLKQILQLAEENMRENPVYFENYKELIVKYFNPDSFYLTPTGIAIYFQQYEIAPYSTGIVVFEIPYESLGLQKPACKA